MTYKNSQEQVQLTGKTQSRGALGEFLEVFFEDGHIGYIGVEDVTDANGFHIFTFLEGDEESDPCWDYISSNDTYPDLASAVDAFICNNDE